MVDRERSHTSPVETTGDDRLVARGFWRSMVLVMCLTGTIVGFLLFRTKPAVKPGSAEPAASPSAPPSAAITPPRGVSFVDVAHEAGVDFVHESGARGGKLLPECLAGGAAIVDLDRDGRLDIVFTQGEPLEPVVGDPAIGRGGIRVYMNATTDGTLKFVRLVGDDALIAGCFANGIAAGDINGDGRADLYVSCVGRDRLLLNTTAMAGTPSFVEQAVPDEREWGTSVGMLDANGDGRLDVVVANYVRWSPAIDRSVNYTLDGIGRAYGPPTGFEGSMLTMLLNTDEGLRDVTETSGVAIKNPVTGAPYAKALGLAFVDVDRDGRTDILVANDRTPKFLLRNEGPSDDGTPRFADIATAWGFAFDRDGSATGAMGIDFAWPRNNNELAIAVGNFANEPSSLYVAPIGSATLSDEALGQGFGAPTRRFLTFGTLFVDVDLDGHEDLLQANGHLEPDIARVAPSQTYAQRGQLFMNRGGASIPLFIEAPPETTGDFATPVVGRALAAGDLDGDGDADLVEVHLGGRARILRNDQRTGNHWIALALDGGSHPGRALGAEIEVDVDATKERDDSVHTQRRALTPTRSYLSQNEPIARFGLGAATEIREVRVRTTDGDVYRVHNVPIDRFTTLVLDELTVDARHGKGQQMTSDGH